jgi:hypothetical protein
MSLTVGANVGVRTSSVPLVLIGTIGTALVFARALDLAKREQSGTESLPWAQGVLTLEGPDTDWIWVTLAGLIVRHFSLHEPFLLQAGALDGATGSDSTSASTQQAAAAEAAAIEARRTELGARVSGVHACKGHEAKLRELIETATAGELDELEWRIRVLQGIENQDLPDALRQNVRRLVVIGRMEDLARVQTALNMRRGPRLFTEVVKKSKPRKLGLKH